MIFCQKPAKTRSKKKKNHWTWYENENKPTAYQFTRYGMVIFGNVFFRLQKNYTFTRPNNEDQNFSWSAHCVSSETLSLYGCVFAKCWTEFWFRVIFLSNCKLFFSCIMPTLLRTIIYIMCELFLFQFRFILSSVNSWNSLRTRRF